MTTITATRAPDSRERGSRERGFRETDGRQAPRARAASGPRAGLTLLELMLVFAIMGLLMGIGLGAFAELDFSRGQALGLVKSSLRATRNAAVSRGGPALVRFTPGTGRIQATSLEVVGTWHFEDALLTGANGLEGTSHGAVLVDDGQLGRALFFGGGVQGARAEWAVDGLAAFDARGGFRIDVAMRIDEEGGGAAVTLGRSAGILANSAGRVRGYFFPEGQSESGAPVRLSGSIQVESDAGALAVSRWVPVALEYDRYRLRLFVDGVVVAEMQQDQPVWKVDAPLVLSDKTRTFPGSLDTLVISAMAGEEDLALPAGVVFAPDTAKVVRFDAGGGLDRGLHREPAFVRLRFEDGSEAEVRVGLFGTVEG